MVGAEQENFENLKMFSKPLTIFSKPLTIFSKPLP